MSRTRDYADELRKIRSLLIVTSLQKRQDLKAVKLITTYDRHLQWEPLDNLMIDSEVWKYAVKKQGYEPKMVFCHPDVLKYRTETGLYYRGLCGLSIKAAKGYFGTVENLEAGSRGNKLDDQKALKMARTYNTFICSVIKNSTKWTLENGKRTVIATLGITLDGKMRNRIGKIAEERSKALVLEWLIDNELLIRPRLKRHQIFESLSGEFILTDDIIMKFGSEPDILFYRGEEYLAVVEIKGGTDEAGALERYGAATKSFQSAVSTSPHCTNFFVCAIFTPELHNRIKRDRLVSKSFNLVDILEDPATKEAFLTELFHHSLRLI